MGKSEKFGENNNFYNHQCCRFSLEQASWVHYWVQCLFSSRRRLLVLNHSQWPWLYRVNVNQSLGMILLVQLFHRGEDAYRAHQLISNFRIVIPKSLILYISGPNCKPWALSIFYQIKFDIHSRCLLFLKLHTLPIIIFVIKYAPFIYNLLKFGNLAWCKY